jgi:amino acid adenylation domain-containing protein
LTEEPADFRGLSAGFLDSVQRFPSRPALEVSGKEFTYRELFDRAAKIAATLQRHAAPSEIPLTGVLAHRSPTAFAGILGALIGGNGYVPLNPYFPADRTASMLNRSQATGLVVGHEATDALKQILPRADRSLTIVMPDTLELQVFKDSFPGHVFIGQDALESASSYEEKRARPEDVAYLLFTSGSTGQPKGVQISHRNIRHFVDYVTERYAIAETDRLSQMFELVFDLSLFDMFVSWEKGACLCCPSREEAQLPARYIKNSKISIWFSVPSLALHMKQMRMLRADAYPSLRLSLFCGEALLADVVTAWAEAAPNSIIENLYGPTEVTLACTVYRWDPLSSMSECEQGLVPIGVSFPGLRYMIADEDLKSVEPGASGELLMAGPQVAPGYWHDDEKTKAAFVVPPGKSEIFYRTGDLVLESDGNGPIKYLGRLDHQIKIRGNRVELGEIEASIRKVSKADIAVAIGWPVSAAGADGIVAFIEGEESRFDPERIRGKLEEILPAHMIPKELKTLPKMPLNPNGKVDRKALRAQLEASSSRAGSQVDVKDQRSSHRDLSPGVVVVGSPRSGTTLIRRVLDAHPNIACPGETCLLSAAARFLHREVVADGLEFGVLNGLAFAGFEPSETLERLRGFAFGFHQEHAHRKGKNRWAEKTAVDVFHLPEIEMLCGDHVQYVCVVRHGLDVACSLREFSNRGLTYLSELHEYIQRNPRPLEAFCQAWVDATRAVLDLHMRRPSDSILVRYEDFVADPMKEGRRLFEFLGEHWQDDIVSAALSRSGKSGLGDWKAYSRTSIGAESVARWHALPPGVISRLGEICNPTLQECGYEPVRILPGHDQREARKRYNLALSVGLGNSEKG